MSDRFIDEQIVRALRCLINNTSSSTEVVAAIVPEGAANYEIGTGSITIETDGTGVLDFVPAWVTIPGARYLFKFLAASASNTGQITLTDLIDGMATPVMNGVDSDATNVSWDLSLLTAYGGFISGSAEFVAAGAAVNVVEDAALAINSAYTFTLVRIS